MKRLIPLFTILFYSLASFAQVIPIIEIRINDTQTAKDDYVNSNYIPCKVRLFNGASFAANIPVTLRNIPFNTGGQVLLSATGGASSGSTTLDLVVNKDNSFSTFYIKGRPGYNSIRDKDAILEVIDNRATNNSIVLARKALMVVTVSPLPVSLPQVEIQVNSVSTLDDYVTWSPTPCSIRLVNHTSFSSSVDVTLKNMSSSVGKLYFANSNLSNNSTASDSSLNLTLPNSGTWVNFFIAGKFANTSQKDKDAIIEVLKAGAETLTKRDTVISLRDSTVSILDTVITFRDTVNTLPDTAIAFRDTTIAIPDSAIILRDTTIAVLNTAITFRDTTISIPYTAITFRDTTITVPYTETTFRDAIITLKDTTISLSEKLIINRDTTVSLRDTLISSVALKDSVRIGNNLVISIKGTVVAVRDSIISVRGTLVPVRDTLIISRDSLYTIRDSVLSTRDSVYTIQDLVLTFRDSLYTIRDSVITSRDSLYTIRSVLITSRDSLYTLRDTIISLRDSMYTIRDSVIMARDTLMALRDTVITVRDTLIAGGAVISREPLMVRVRKNANNLSLEERQRFLNAISTLNSTFNGYTAFINIHTNAGKPEAHNGPAFLPWHRAYILDLERELQSIDPSVSLPYWKFDQAAGNVFSLDFMGSKPTALGDSFTDFNADDPLISWNVPGGPGVRRTTAFANNAAPSTAQASLRNEVATLALGDRYDLFRVLEDNPHGYIHNLAGSLSGDWLRTITTSVNDPIFFLVHSNVDRLWAKWQWINTRFDSQSSLAYSPQGSFPSSGTIHIGHYLNDTMWPWNGITGTYTGSGTVLIGNRPTTAPGGPVYAALSISAPIESPRPLNMIDYKNNRLLSLTNSGMGFCYDDVPFQ